MSRARALSTPTAEDVLTGLSVTRFKSLARSLGLDNETLGRQLGIAPATLYRRMAAGKFTSQEGDRLARLLRLYARALEILGNPESVREWFMNPNPSLGGSKPFELVKTDPGSVEVERLLSRIEYGVF
jgi:putative toxin-antitoxin system antitoxin component (TIGR02293 family)